MAKGKKSSCERKVGFDMKKSSIYGKILKKKPKSERSKLIKACDSTIREIVLIRDNHTCQRSGKKTRLQVAHYFSRSYLRTRWDESNLITLNSGVHLFWAHKKPEEFRDFYISKIGQEEFDRLKLRTRVRGTIYAHELKIILVGLKIRLAEMKL
ncbi:hypothetical protein LCGC14_2395190 [marine sediment metagenome]|uniref:Uncharacterized protein n=1 Tax=marine sediment metagenome TaxID=412755 RepID=A0A0F9E9D1_9ZZZZ